MKINVVFDNGGGVTIMAEGYTHYYDRPAQAAEDYKAMISPDFDGFDGWDGNDLGAVMEYDADEARNGGYIWADTDDIAAPTDRLLNWGHNTQLFFAALQS